MNYRIILLICLLYAELSICQTPEAAGEPIVLDSIVFEQVGDLIINNDILTLEDPLEWELLLNSFDAFLSEAQINTEHTLTLPSQRVETQLLTDEIEGIQISEEFQNEKFFRPYVTNVVPLQDEEYLVKVSYIGVYKGSPLLRANFEIIAHAVDDGFLFSSPLVRNTESWHSYSVKNHVYHYPDVIDEESARLFTEKVILYDDKLENNKGEYHYYVQHNGVEPLRLFGVDYKSDYNGYRLSSRWEAQNEGKSLWVANEDRIFNYDRHDLWHNRLRRVISRSEVHRRVDCHIATLHGGMWGLSWDELFPMFYKEFYTGDNVDWLEHKTKKSHFLTTERNRKNYSDDFVGALLINKIEQEKGFDQVWKLLKTQRTKEEVEYFEVLEELTGISIANYNVEVTKLIKAELKNHNM